MPWFSAPVAGLALVAGLLPTPVSSALAAAAMLRGLEGWTVSPLHTIGEAIGDYVPVGKPDGIGAFRRGDGRVRILVNHELWRSRGASYRLRNDVELIGARISYFDVDARSRTIVTAGIATASVFDRARQPVTAASQVSELPDGRTIGFGRFCSGQAVAAGTFGLVDDVYFVGEEVRPPRGHPFGGSVWALDVATGALWAVPAMGRGAWENVTPLATGDAGRVAFLLGDDTREAPLYLYVGTKRDGGFLERNGLAQGRLYVWRADAGDLSAETFHGTGSRRAGRFVEIEIFSSVGYIDHPAQHAAARAVGAFRFARPEDLATDPRNPRRAVFASTGGNDRWGTIYLYHRAECLTHVGDSQAVRSLTQCGEPMRFAMAAPIDLRNDFDSVSLRRLAKRTRDATQSRRLLALAEVYDGGSRTDASRIGGVGLQIIRDWVLRFNARGPDGLVDGKSPGAPSKLNADHRRALAEVVEAGPVPAVDGVVRWRRKDLARWLLETFAISLDETTVGRELKALGFAKISARPRHYAQNELAVEAFKKNFPAELAKIRARLPKGVEIELWWQDEARIGQKNKLTRRWARRGTRPRAPRDQRTEWAYIFGAICPAKGKGAGLVMPWCDTDAMAAHLIEISAAVDPGAHAVLIVDQAGWHLTPKLAIPDNITVLALPPRSPELNPVENVWQFMRDNWLSNRIFKSYEDIVALCCQAWNNLIDQPWKIMSLGMRKWAHGF